ncbi:Fum6p, partial [Fusarium bulbicola]
MSVTGKLTRRSVSTSNPELRPIPGPKPLPLLGNLLDFDFNNLTKSLGELGKIHGPIYSITFGASTEIMVTSRKIAQELCDETRFCKLPGGALDKIKQVVGDGLFTAETSNPKWAIAHRIVTPLFGTMRIRGMFDDMKDICEQMCLRWARFGPDEPLNVCDNMTKLTLDTIALCTIDYRFNSFYRENGSTNPFAEAVVDVMTESFDQSNLPDFVNNYVRFRSMAKFKRQAAELRRQTEDLIAARRQNPVDRDDLLNAMLSAKDPKTGQGLGPESIVDNLLTFLIAGHETTSSLLSFCFYYLLENPDVLRKVQQEVDTVLGSDTITVDHLSNMPYLEAVLRETLRLRDPGPGFYVKPLRDDVVAGKYAVKKDQPLFIVFDSVHRDESTYGADADEFCPERMLKDSFDKLPPCAWKPFGNGVRACVGRPFAMQQAMLAVAMVVHKFDLIKDESYTLKYHVTMTVRPVGFTMKVRIRQGQRATDLAMGLYQGYSQEASAAASRPSFKRLSSNANGDDPDYKSQIVILYASNLRSCEALAGRLAAEATERGFGIRAVDIVNNAIDRVPVGSPVIIITASYNGEPADDAQEFVPWLKSLESGRLNGVKFAVFGNGHRDWANTLFAVPRLIDSELARCGAERVSLMGVSDTCDSNDPFSDFERWIDEKLFPKLEIPNGPGEIKNGDKAVPRQQLQVSLGQPPRITMRKGYVRAIVTKARSLSSPGVPEKRHLELLLPKEFSYKAGDHVYILPRNNSRDVVRALNYFGLGEDTLITIRNTARKLSLGLPLDTPIGATDLLAAYVELGRTASLKNLYTLVDAAGHESRNGSRATLLSLTASERFKAEIQDKHVSILDLLERFPDIDLSLSSFLSMLVQIRPRAYSFSSAPDWKPGHATLTYTVVNFANSATQGINGTSKSEAVGEGMVVHRQGLASSYLSSLAPGTSLYISLHSASPYFCLQKNTSLPVIMVGAGTGLAPFRAFLQERRLAAEVSKQRLGLALLFFGCRGPRLDSLYSVELESYEAMGIVKVRRAYSRDPSAQDAQGCKYVADRLGKCRDEVARLWTDGAQILVCGGKKMANDVLEVLGPILLETDQNRGETTAKTVVEWKARLDKW